MPEQPLRAERPRCEPAALDAAEGPAYAELQVASCFSFLRGASHPEELVERAVELGYRALAIADDGSLAGVVRAHVAARGQPLRLLIGAGVTLEDGPRLLLHAQDRAGYGRLARLITRGRRRADKGSYRLSLSDVLDHAQGLLATVADPGHDPRTPAPPPDRRALQRLREAFGEGASLAVTLLRGPDDAGHLARRRALADAVGLPLVAAGDVHLHLPERQRLQDVMTCIRAGVTLEEACAAGLLFPNAERHLRPRAALARIYRGAEDALARTVELAERCTFSLEELRYEYPDELVPAGKTPAQHLAELTWTGARRRYPEGVPERVRALIDRELRLIAELRFEPFFLTVHEVVEYARAEGIYVQGRGSAANSAVCFCLGITAVDPATFDVLFERFVSRARAEPPDIDVDIEHERREEVIQHIYEKYGRDRAAIAATVITYRTRSAVRDVAKVFGLGEGPIEGDDPRSALARQVILELHGFPRHLSQHVGGFVITRGPLAELVPIENAAMSGRTVVEWDKDDLEALGILKVDCLGLGMLTCIRKAFALIAEQGGPRLELASIPPDDPDVYAMLCRADAIGVFQVESRAQLNMLPRLRPRCFYDLVIEVSLVRPGPIQGGMVHPYLRRRQGEEPVTSISPAADRVLAKTLGVPIFQEQAMRLAIEAAGFTPDQAEALRKAMGAWRREGVIEKFRRLFLSGAIARGVRPGDAERLFDQISGFGEYGFPESHAASFARLTYLSAWLKRHYPAAFSCALLNSLPMGFYAPAQLVRDAREHGVPILPVDVEASGWDHRLEWREVGAGEERLSQDAAAAAQGDRTRNINSKQRMRTGNAAASAEERSPTPAPAQGEPPLRPPGGLQPAGRGLPPREWGAAGPAIRLGMRRVRGLAERDGRRIEVARARGGPFGTVARLARRTGVGREALERLAEADALRSLTPSGAPEAPLGEGRPRRDALFDALAERGHDLPLFRQADPREEPAALPALSEAGEVHADYATTGLSLRRHPLSLARKQLAELGAVPLEALLAARDGSRLCVAGLVICRQRPSTAGGIVFTTLEDETGVGNLLVRPRQVERYARVLPTSRCLLAHGKVEREGAVVHLLVTKLRDLSDLIGDLRVESYDFR